MKSKLHFQKWRSKLEVYNLMDIKVQKTSIYSYHRNILLDLGLNSPEVMNGFVIFLKSQLIWSITSANILGKLQW